MKIAPSSLQYLLYPDATYRGKAGKDNKADVGTLSKWLEMGDSPITDTGYDKKQPQ